MAKVYDSIGEDIRAFILKQHVFFVATAPLSGDGHINLSPKGMDCFRILGAQRVAYLDLTGSGNETSAHLAENGRITFMFAAFEGSPNIVRLYGRGRTVLPEDEEWAALVSQFPHYAGVRQILVADIHRVSTSCGYAVPFMEYTGERETLVKYWEAKCDEVSDYQREKNSTSIDGLKTPLGTARE